MIFVVRPPDANALEEQATAQRKRRTMPGLSTMISPRPDPQPPGMAAFAKSAMRFGEWPRQRRVIGKCEWNSTPQFRGLSAWGRWKAVPILLSMKAADCQWSEVQRGIGRTAFTPAPDGGSVKWKQAALVRGDHRYTDVKPERIERAIADDLAFLAAHPVRQSNSEAWARRREFKEAMRQHIRDIAASRDLSDEDQAGPEAQASRDR
jgi:hypothetical protein